MSESYAAPRSTNRNKNDKESKLSRSQRLGVGATLAALIVVGGGSAAKAIHDMPRSNPAEITAEMPGEIDADLKDQLVLLQAANDRDYTSAPKGVDLLGTWKLLGNPHSITISEGGSIVADALAVYRHEHDLGDQDTVPQTITNSITVTANNYVERDRAEGGDGHVQPGQELALTEVQDENGTTWAVVSGPVKYDTN